MMDTVVVDGHNNLGPLPCLIRAMGLDNLLDQPDEAVGILVFADQMGHLARHEVDSAKTISLHVLAGCRDLALLTTFCLAADDAH